MSDVIVAVWFAVVLPAFIWWDVTRFLPWAFGQRQRPW